MPAAEAWREGHSALLTTPFVPVQMARCWFGRVPAHFSRWASPRSASKRRQRRSRNRSPCRGPRRFPPLSPPLRLPLRRCPRHRHPRLRRVLPRLLRLRRRRQAHRLPHRRRLVTHPHNDVERHLCTQLTSRPLLFRHGASCTRTTLPTQGLPALYVMSRLRPTIVPVACSVPLTLLSSLCDIHDQVRGSNSVLLLRGAMSCRLDLLLRGGALSALTLIWPLLQMNPSSASQPARLSSTAANKHPGSSSARWRTRVSAMSSWCVSTANAVPMDSKATCQHVVVAPSAHSYGPYVTLPQLQAEGCVTSAALGAHAV